MTSPESGESPGKVTGALDVLNVQISAKKCAVVLPAGAGMEAALRPLCKVQEPAPGCFTSRPGCRGGGGGGGGPGRAERSGAAPRRAPKFGGGGGSAPAGVRGGAGGREASSRPRPPAARRGCGERERSWRAAPGKIRPRAPGSGARTEDDCGRLRCAREEEGRKQKLKMRTTGHECFVHTAPVNGTGVELCHQRQTKILDVRQQFLAWSTSPGFFAGETFPGEAAVCAVLVWSPQIWAEAEATAFQLGLHGGDRELLSHLRVLGCGTSAVVQAAGLALFGDLV